MGGQGGGFCFCSPSELSVQCMYPLHVCPVIRLVIWLLSERSEVCSHILVALILFCHLFYPKIMCPHNLRLHQPEHSMRSVRAGEKFSGSASQQNHFQANVTHPFLLRFKLSPSCSGTVLLLTTPHIRSCFWCSVGVLLDASHGMSFHHPGRACPAACSLAGLESSLRSFPPVSHPLLLDITGTFSNPGSEQPFPLVSTSPHPEPSGKHFPRGGPCLVSLLLRSRLSHQKHLLTYL